MNDLIKVTYNVGEPTVSARDLHEGLEIGTRFNDWFPRMAEYGFTEGKDFYSKMSKTSEGGRPATDYDITVDMAKQICMIQRNEKGKQYREYFLELEKAWNTPEQVFARALRMADQTINSLKDRCQFLGGQVEEQQKVIEELQPKASYRGLPEGEWRGDEPDGYLHLCQEVSGHGRDDQRGPEQFLHADG